MNPLITRSAFRSAARTICRLVATSGLVSIPLASNCDGVDRHPPRIFRIIVPNPQKPSEYVLKQATTNGTGAEAILSFLESQRLGRTDLVIVQWPSFQLREVVFGDRPFFRGLVRLCDSPRAQLSYYAAPAGSPDISTATVVHWETPFDSPLDGTQARYFIEGEALGTGEAGLTNLMNQLEIRSPRRIVLARSRYDQSLPTPPGPYPFDQATLTRLEVSWKAKGIVVLNLQDHNFDLFPPDRGLQTRTNGLSR